MCTNYFFNTNYLFKYRNSMFGRKLYDPDYISVFPVQCALMKKKGPRFISGYKVCIHDPAVAPRK